ncbi:MAG: SMI1/KNR4 family protein [Polyangia bacterium]
MIGIDWNEFLRDYNVALIEDEALGEQVAEEALGADWLGAPGLDAKALAALEKRLGTTLPKSYRDFLAASDGWRITGALGLRLWPAAKIGWLRDTGAAWVKSWGSASGDARPVPDAEYFVYGDEQDAGSMRHEYVDSALQIGDSEDNGIYLLNPKIVTPDGEWEAWHLAPFYPGAARFRSFEEMIVQERSELRRSDDDE